MLNISASIGVAIYSGACPDASGLVHEADLAMYAAKAKGGARYEIYAAK